MILWQIIKNVLYVKFSLLFVLTGLSKNCFLFFSSFKLYGFKCIIQHGRHLIKLLKISKFCIKITFSWIWLQRCYPVYRVSINFMSFIPGRQTRFCVNISWMLPLHKISYFCNVVLNLCVTYEIKVIHFVLLNFVVLHKSWSYLSIPGEQKSV